MTTCHITRIRRLPRLGRSDGTSEQGMYAVRWTDEDTGPHTAMIPAQDEQQVRDLLEPLIGSNTLVIRKVSA